MWLILVLIVIGVVCSLIRLIGMFLVVWFGILICLFVLLCVIGWFRYLFCVGLYVMLLLS